MRPQSARAGRDADHVYIERRGLAHEQQRSARRPRMTCQAKNETRQQHAVGEQAAARAIEVAERTVRSIEARRREPLREQFRRKQRLSHADAGDGVDEAGRVAEQHEAWRNAATRSARERTLARDRADRFGTTQELAQLHVLLDLRPQPGARITRDCRALRQCCEHHLIVRQRRQVELVAAGEEHLDALGNAYVRGEPEVRAQAKARPAIGWPVEARTASHDRTRTVGGNDEPRAVFSTRGPYAHHAATLADRTLDPQAFMHRDAGRCAGGLEQRRVQAQPALAQAEGRHARCRRKRSAQNVTPCMMAHAAQDCTSDRFAQAEPLQHADAGRKDALGAGFVARKAPLLEQLYLEAGASGENRERRSATPPPQMITCVTAAPGRSAACGPCARDTRHDPSTCPPRSGCGGRGPTHEGRRLSRP